MAENPKTIQIFLPDGSPRSIKIADITQHIPRVVLFPRSRIKEAGLRPETKNAGIYFLFGTSDEKAKPIVYIGESEDCYERIKQHNRSKDFWDTGIIITSKTNSFTRTHVGYLEWYCLKKAREIGRYTMENTELPKKPSISEPMEADLRDSFESIKVLLSTLNYPIFEKIRKEITTDLLYCKGKRADAEGAYTDDGFIVFKGSKANVTETPTAGDWVINLRSKLKGDSILESKQDHYVFVSAYIFTSPSAAAAAVLARRANGWTEWKTKDGMTLDKLKRKS
jgi:hypothetical protein